MREVPGRGGGHRRAQASPNPFHLPTVDHCAANQLQRRLSLVNAACCPPGMACDDGLPAACSFECAMEYAKFYSDCYGASLKRALALCMRLNVLRTLTQPCQMMITQRLSSHLAALLTQVRWWSNLGWIRARSSTRSTRPACTRSTRRACSTRPTRQTASKYDGHRGRHTGRRGLISRVVHVL